MGSVAMIRDAWERHNGEACEAFVIYRGYCGGNAPARVPGMDTAMRLAMRIARGKTPVEAAADEYLYRWRLAIKTPDQCDATGSVSRDPRDRNPRACVSIFGIPHTVGM
jgi:hypothetical protein